MPQRATTEKFIKCAEEIHDFKYDYSEVVYEFYGDMWHGNPKVYKPDFYNSMCYKTAAQLYQQTMQRENLIKSLGYNIVHMWESEYHKY